MPMSSNPRVSTHFTIDIEIQWCNFVSLPRVSLWFYFTSADYRSLCCNWLNLALFSSDDDFGVTSFRHKEDWM